MATINCMGMFLCDNLIRVGRIWIHRVLIAVNYRHWPQHTRELISARKTSFTHSFPRLLQSPGGPEVEADVLLQAILLAAVVRRSGKVIPVQSLTL